MTTEGSLLASPLTRRITTTCNQRKQCPIGVLCYHNFTKHLYHFIVWRDWIWSKCCPSQELPVREIYLNLSIRKRVKCGFSFRIMLSGVKEPFTYIHKQHEGTQNVHCGVISVLRWRVPSIRIHSWKCKCWLGTLKDIKRMRTSSICPYAWFIFSQARIVRWIGVCTVDWCIARDLLS
jgi:hypothetical protein